MIKTKEPIALRFKSWEEAEEAYYKTNEPLSDDPDLEEGRIMRWLEYKGYSIEE